MTAMLPRPRLRIEIDQMQDDGDTSLSANVDFLHDGSERGQRAAQRSLDVLTKIVDGDDRMDCDESGGGDNVVGLSLTVVIT